MTKVEAIESEVKSLNSEELAKFRVWFAEYDSELWDKEIETDANSGRFEALAAAALAEHGKGESTAL